MLAYRSLVAYSSVLCMQLLAQDPDRFEDPDDVPDPDGLDGRRAPDGLDADGNAPHSHHHPQQ